MVGYRRMILNFAALVPGVGALAADPRPVSKVRFR